VSYLIARRAATRFINLKVYTPEFIRLGGTLKLV